jgi:hypothetical protein
MRIKSTAKRAEYFSPSSDVVDTASQRLGTASVIDTNLPKKVGNDERQSGKLNQIFDSDIHRETNLQTKVRSTWREALARRNCEIL